MGGISVDAEWITGYARTVEQAAGELTAALRALEGAPLGGAAFGEFGRAAGAVDAYGHAAGALQAQVSRASDALRSAAEGLRGIAGSHTALDEEQAAALRRVHPA